MASYSLKSPASLGLRMEILDFISNDEKNTLVKTSRRKRRFEKMSRERGLVANFEHVGFFINHSLRVALKNRVLRRRDSFREAPENPSIFFLAKIVLTDSAIVS